MAPDTKDLIVYGPKKELQVPAVSVGEYCLEHLQKYGDRVAVVQQEDGSELTFSDLLRQSKAVAGFLREQGLGSGDTVMLCCGTTLEYPPILIGTMFIGAALAGVVENYSTDDMLHVLKVDKPQVIISSKVALKTFQDALSKYEPTVPLITLETVSSCFNDDSYLKDFHLGLVEDPETHVALVKCSSGSTGKPKGVEVTHFRFLSMLYVERFPPNDEPDVEYTVLNDIPPCWSVPLFLSLHCLCYGYKMVLSNTKDVEEIFKTIQKYKVNMTLQNPRNIISWTEYPSIDEYDLSSLKNVVCGGSSISSRLQEVAQSKFNCLFYNTYGLSECAGQMRPDWSLTHTTNSVGKLAVNMAAKVVDVETRELLGPNCTGELCFKSWNVFKAYRGNPQATREMFDDDGFFLSGDLGYYDNEGYFYVVDRIKEVFKYKLRHVSPTDIEDVLLQHASVLEAAVVGIPHEVDCDHARAFIVLRKGASATEEELEKLVQDKLPSYMWLYGGVRFLESLPRTTAARKVKKFVLRKLGEEN